VSLDRNWNRASTVAGGGGELGGPGGVGGGGGNGGGGPGGGGLGGDGGVMHARLPMRPAVYVPGGHGTHAMLPNVAANVSTPQGKQNACAVRF